MTSDTSIGLDDPRDGSRDAQQSGIDDEERAEKAREDGGTDAPGRDLTREDIKAGNDHSTSADQNNRSGRTNKLDDDGIQLGNT